MLQAAIIASDKEINKKVINPSVTIDPDFPPAIGIIFPAPVIAAIVTDIKFANEP